jgi:hypothetical protein
MFASVLGGLAGAHWDAPWQLGDGHDVERRVTDVLDFLQRADYSRRPAFLGRGGLCGRARSGFQRCVPAQHAAPAGGALALATADLVSPRVEKFEFRVSNFDFLRSFFWQK